MIKKALSVSLALVMSLSMVACGGNSNTGNDTPKADGGAAATETKDTSGETPVDDGVFIVGFDAEFPPYGYLDDSGEYTGLDLDLAEEVCARNGWELKKQPIDWDSKDMELSSGSIDCIWNGFTMTGRESEYTWSVPYIDSSIVVVVDKDSDITSLSDLAGATVMTQADSSGLHALTSEDADPEDIELAESFALLEQIADYNSAFMNLEAGAVDAVVVDIGVAYAQMSAKPDAFRMLDEEIVVEQYAVGFLLGNEDLRDQVQATMFEMLDDGKFMKIVDSYADQGITQEMICLGSQTR